MKVETKAHMICVAVMLISFLNLNSHTQQNDFPLLKGPYLGQKAPGITPEVFAPGIVSTEADEYAFEISSSGDEMLFIRKNSIMLVTRNGDGTWNKPFVAPFSGKFIDDEPFFSPDGQKIYFMSRRPSSGSKYPSNLWIAQKKDDKWMEPFRLKAINPSKLLHAPSIASSGNIYEDGIARFKYLNGKYLPEEKIGSLKGMSPFISPDESYIIFAARLPGKNDSDLFISFHSSDGIWSKGISLGNEINSLTNESNSFVTADGKYLFFSRKFDIYWVSAKVIEELRQKKLK